MPLTPEHLLSSAVNNPISDGMFPVKLLRSRAKFSVDDYETRACMSEIKSFPMARVVTVAAHDTYLSRRSINRSR